MTVRAAPTWGKGLPGLETGSGHGVQGTEIEEVRDRKSDGRSHDGVREDRK